MGRDLLDVLSAKKTKMVCTSASGASTVSGRWLCQYLWFRRATNQLWRWPVRSQRLLSAGAMAVISAFMVSCGGTTVTSTLSNGTTSATGKPAAVRRTKPAPNRQEIVEASKCLEEEDVRPAKHTAYKSQIPPRGTSEVTRGGLPMTPEEYDSSVRRCATTARSAQTFRRK